jgi:ATP-dependent DNA helicase PIF1
MSLFDNQYNLNAFSKEQQICFDKYILGCNLFITGPGGTGKSYLIKQIYLNAILRSKTIYVTALTGCAAILLGCKARTIHSWAGIGLGNNTVENLIIKIKKNPLNTFIWKNTDILVIDEISMLSLKLFTILNEIGKILRNSSKPFGGIQLIFSGDFYQLPPIGNSDDTDTQRFCFESDDWNSIFHRDCQIQLIKIFRQTDNVYASILNQIREGKIKRKSIELLMQYVGRTFKDSLIIEPTKLFPTRNKVDMLNNFKVSSIEGTFTEYNVQYLSDLEMTKQDKLFRSKFTEKDIQNEYDYLTNNLLCEKCLRVKIGAQVMCIVNIKGTDLIHDIHDNIRSCGEEIVICNGSQGIITSYCEITGYPKVKFNNGIERIMTRHIWQSEKIPWVGISQIPLILAWALTIHKSQGVSLDMAEIDVGTGIFEFGQTYVALSRVKTMDGLYLSSFDITKIRINKKVKDFYEALTTYQKTNLNNEEIYIPISIDTI